MQSPGTQRFIVHFSLTLFLFLVVTAVWSLVTVCISSTCSRSGNSLVLVHCLTHESCSLFLCFRVQFYTPIKGVAKSKLAVSGGSFMDKFCHLSWVCVQYPDPGLGTGFSVLRSDLDCLSCSSSRHLELYHCVTGPKLWLKDVCQGAVYPFFHIWAALLIMCIDLRSC